MKNRVLSFVLVLAISLSFAAAAPVTAMAADADWKTIYKNKVLELASNLTGNWDDYNKYDLISFIVAIELADINFDGVPELMVYGDGAGASSCVICYTIVNGSAQVFLKDYGNPYYDYDNGDSSFLKLRRNRDTGAYVYVLSSLNGSMDGKFGTYYMINSSTILSANRTEWGEGPLSNRIIFGFNVAYDYETDEKISEKYTANGKNVSEKEYETAFREYFNTNLPANYKIASVDLDLSSDNKNVSAAQLLAFFDTYVREPGVITDPLDTASTWARDGITSAIDKGLVPKGLQNYYTGTITRAEFCALIVALYETAAGKAITDRKTFSDTNDVNVEKAAAIGVVSGTNTATMTFSPNTQLTREQAAIMLSRLAGVLGKPLQKQMAAFADNGSISSWAIEGVGQVQAAGIMQGSNNKFSPQSPYTREQSIITIMRLYDIVK